MKKFEYHPASKIFPMMSKEEAAGLRKDIKENGQCYAIELFDTKILDGRNRYEACQELGIECETVDVTADIDDPADHVRSVNLHRRHLSASQRAMSASKHRDYHAREAEKRRLAGLKRGSKAPVPVIIPEREKGDSRDAVGKDYDVSGSMVDRARNVIDQGAPELIEAVDSGEITVSMATKMLDLPAKEQRQIAKAEEPAKEAKRILREKKEAVEAISDDKPATCLRHAHAAVDCLRRIPRNDKHKKRAFQIVTDFIEQQSK